jgi:hypothetical protein
MRWRTAVKPMTNPNHPSQRCRILSPTKNLAKVTRLRKVHNSGYLTDGSTPTDLPTAEAQRTQDFCFFLCVSAFSAVKSRKFAVAVLHCLI